MKTKKKRKIKKTERDLYQSTTEGMKVLKLPGEIESNNEKSQTYFSEIKIIFLIFIIYTKGFLCILLIRKKSVLTAKCFHLKLQILIFMVNMVLCTTI